LNEQLLKEKQRIDSSTIQKQKELSEALAKLKALNEQMVKSKDEQIDQLSGQKRPRTFRNWPSSKQRR